jgi:pimeloyl-ACP methyl ester carboxylesterase
MVPATLATIAEAWFAGGRQSWTSLPRSWRLELGPNHLGTRGLDQPGVHVEALASRLPVHILNDAGHLPHMEKAGEVNRLMRRFVG